MTLNRNRSDLFRFIIYESVEIKLYISFKDGSFGKCFQETFHRKTKSYSFVPRHPSAIHISSFVVPPPTAGAAGAHIFSLLSSRQTALLCASLLPSLSQMCKRWFPPPVPHVPHVTMRRGIQQMKQEVGIHGG